MQSAIIIKNGTLVNEMQQTSADILVKDGLISEIGSIPAGKYPAAMIIDATGKYVFPGVIDDQVHFREPGLTHKADIESESIAAVAGGITSFMEMPNTVPQATTQAELAKKFQRAAEVSRCNYSFYIGATNDNLSELLASDPSAVCGVKVFMGSSTGNMLVDKEESLNKIFSQVKILVATHCEDETIIQSNIKAFKEKYGEDVPVECHPLIRSEEACYASSARAAQLAGKYGTRLHILHLSTAKELELLSDKPISEKNITAEACVHHLWFSGADYKEKAELIKWNPAVKTQADRDALLAAVISGRIDVIATDHAPHLLAEKQNSYFKSAAGGPLVQHSLVAMLELAKQGKISIETVIDRMCHKPAQLFRIEKRGFLREGYHADICIVDPQAPWTVDKSNILYKCGWSPFEGQVFSSKVSATLVNGTLAYGNGLFGAPSGKPLKFCPVTL
jgi:dihydroorotase